ncbi:MAG: hypothetical protein QXX12_04500 [Nanopusillaceae archaeon]
MMYGIVSENFNVDAIINNYFSRYNIDYLKEISQNMNRKELFLFIHNTLKEDFLDYVYDILTKSGKKLERDRLNGFLYTKLYNDVIWEIVNIITGKKQ